MSFEWRLRQFGCSPMICIYFLMQGDSIRGHLKRLCACLESYQLERRASRIATVVCVYPGPSRTYDDQRPQQHALFALVMIDSIEITIEFCYDFHCSL